MSESPSTPSTFPADWPEDCPPHGTPATGGDYFRVVRTDPPTPDDFLSHRELGKLPKAPPCRRAGLSTFRALDDAEHMALLFPVLGDHVARGTLDAEYGVAMLTPGQRPSHTTVWPYTQTQRTAPFRFVTRVSRAS